MHSSQQIDTPYTSANHTSSQAPTPNWRDLLAKNLSYARGFETQRALAHRAGISSVTVSNLELKKLNRPRAETVARLAIATGNDPHEWLAVVGLPMSVPDLDRLRKLIQHPPQSAWKEMLARKLREARGWRTLSEISRLSGVSKQNISDLENQNTVNSPRPETVARLAIATSNDPHEWLAMIGKSVRSDEVNKLRRAMQLNVSLEACSRADADQRGQQERTQRVAEPSPPTLAPDHGVLP